MARDYTFYFAKTLSGQRFFLHLEIKSVGVAKKSQGRNNN